MNSELIELMEWLCENDWLPSLSEEAIFDLISRFNADRKRDVIRRATTSKGVHDYYMRLRERG